MTLPLSPCLDLLFDDDGGPVRHADRIRRAADAGFAWAEMWGWRTADTKAIARALEDSGVRLNLLTSEPIARIVDRATHREWLRGVDESGQTAAALGCPYAVVLAGDALPGVSRRAQGEAVVDALRRAAPIAARHGITLLLENLNTRVDHVGHFLDRTPEALDIIDAVDRPSVRMLYDLYHSIVMDESPSQVLAARLDRVGHIQIADVPGRHEPGSGHVDWHRELGWLVHAGYHGRIGLEYVPTADTISSLLLIREVVTRLGHESRAAG